MEGNKRRRVLVTGANKGIGLALVRELVSRGDVGVIMGFRKGNNGIDEFNSIKKEYPKADIHYLFVDVTKPQQRQQLATDIQNQFKTIDILVNNAALGYDQPIQVPSRQLAESYLNCNFNSTVLLTEKLLPVLSEDGKIINVSSRVGSLQNHSEEKQALLRDPAVTKEKLFGYVEEYLKGCDGKELNGWCKSAYRTSKSLLNSWSRFILKNQLKGSQSVLVLSPGFCNTDMVKKSHDPKSIEAPNPKAPEQGLSSLLYCIYEVPYSKENSGNFFYNGKQSNQSYESRK